MVKIIGGSDERVVVKVWGNRRRGRWEKEGIGKERAWYLLQAKPRVLIGWRDSAGFLAFALSPV